MSSKIESRPLPAWERWLYGGAGSVAPQAIIGITVDFSSVFAAFTPVAFIGWLIRAALLIAIGGFVSFLHRKETDPWRSFLIGLSAPALLSTLIAGTSHPDGAGIADRPEMRSAFVVHGAQAAMPPDVVPAPRIPGATRGVAVALEARGVG